MMGQSGSSLQKHITKGIGYPKLPYETAYISDITLLTAFRKQLTACLALQRVLVQALKSGLMGFKHRFPIRTQHQFALLYSSGG
jgi:hypothetical protein